MKREAGFRSPRRLAAVLAALAAVAFFSACPPGGGGDDEVGDYTDFLYMTDTVSGEVYYYDPVSLKASAASLASTQQNATGEIRFYQGLGYACVGSGGAMGLYYFDPSAENPTFSKLGGNIAAQYVAFAGPTQAFVSSLDYSGTTSGLYSFDPSDPAAGLSPVAALSGLMLQEIVAAADGYLYAADNANGAVRKLYIGGGSGNPIWTSAGGTTGLCAGTYGGQSGLFVANTGGYDSMWQAQPGSIDFIAQGATEVQTVATALAGGGSIYPGRLVQLENGNLVATAGSGNTYLVTLSGTTAAVTELLAGGASFGSLDIEYKDGLVYVPVASTINYLDYENELYVFDESGAQESYSPLAVMADTTTVGISNIAFYED